MLGADGDAADGVVGEFVFGHHVGVEEVSAVEDDGAAETFFDVGEAGVAELGPLRADDEGVGAVERVHHQR